MTNYIYVAMLSWTYLCFLITELSIRKCWNCKFLNGPQIVLCAFGDRPFMTSQVIRFISFPYTEAFKNCWKWIFSWQYKLNRKKNNLYTINLRLFHRGCQQTFQYCICIDCMHSSYNYVIKNVQIFKFCNYYINSYFI